ncbi:transglutaminase family protein [Pontibacter sp. G13]|uniref:transglutaminase family protein n=1 Tax=Pontibacter sp. G13 TaxID=3074898 RepID=UPI00288A83F0|nr:transglutaminase family protein [Pontibacter sp. G13]WNJ16834.1 transglutaminase family protein [Pontibacter sp. G13]
MKSSELQALISLLDDHDPIVEQHVREKLLSLGEEVIPTLEAAWENQTMSHLQTYLEDIIHLIQSDGTVKSLVAWKRSGGESLLEGWFWVTKYLYAGLEMDRFRTELTRLTSRIWLEMRSGMSLMDRLAVVNTMLFNREHFRTVRKQVPEPVQFLLNGLFDSKRGTSLSVGMLYLLVCQDLELPIQGIVLPGYFILTHQGVDEEFFIDVHNKGAFFPRKDLTRFLKELRIQDEPRYYQPSSHQQIILGLIQSLLRIYQHGRKDQRVRQFNQLLEAYVTD